MDIETSFREMTDRETIRDLARRYAHCVWQKDAAGAAALFTEDGVMNTGDRPPLKGRTAILETYLQIFSESTLCPFVHNHLIELAGDRATGDCYLDLRATVEGKAMTGFGHYQDEYVRVDGDWKFQSRELNMGQLAEDPATVDS